MSPVIEDKLHSMYLALMYRPNQILNIFNNFFGEDRVDMQGFPSTDEFKEWISNATIGAFVSRNSDIFNTRDYEEYKLKKLNELSDEEGILMLNGAISFIESFQFKKGFILVHFPHVRITNEYDKFVDIYHLYAKVVIMGNGTMNGYFALNRAEYTFLHISNDYMHSHVSSIPTSDFTKFKVPCTGTGPINDTISSLTRDFDPDLWELFCLELSKYVEVESIEGTPYHRLENIGSSNRCAVSDRLSLINILPYYSRLDKGMIKEFVSHFIKQGKLKFDYRDGSYSLGMLFSEYVLTISNEFISWYNKKFNNKEYPYSLDVLINAGILRKCIIANGNIYEGNSHTNIESYRRYIGSKICTFKGKDVVVSITDIDNLQVDNLSIILDIPLVLYILSKILRVINYRYGKSKHTDSEGNTISEEIRYI